MQQWIEGCYAMVFAAAAGTVLSSAGDDVYAVSRELGCIVPHSSSVILPLDASTWPV